MFLIAAEDYEWDAQKVMGVLFKFLPVHVPENIKVANIDNIKKNISPANIRKIKREFKFFGPTLELKTRYLHENSFIFKLDVSSPSQTDEDNLAYYKLDETSNRQR